MAQLRHNTLTLRTPNHVENGRKLPRSLILTAVYKSNMTEIAAIVGLKSTHDYFVNTMKLIYKHLIFMAISLTLLLSASANAQFFKQKAEPLLPESEAFAVLVDINKGVLNVSWVIAPDYYMYRDNFDIQSNTPGVVIGEVNYPTGKIEHDETFGEVEVYFFNASLTAPITSDVNEVELVIRGQGCNKPIGVCYPPITKTISVAYEADPNAPAQTAQVAASQTPVIADTEPSASKEADKSFWAYVAAALFAGFLLSFTPCVLPMIPILAGIIAGQQNPSRLQSGWLAICYVFGTIITYAIAGWVAGASGTQLQAHFQSPWVIGVICSILLLLALSLFGAFKIQLPSSIQTKLNGTSVSNRSASISSMLLGLISALVVGACVSPILIVTLGAAITQGDPVLGAAIMAAMALGMGVMLILFGFGAGWLLPKTGAWMNHIQVIFGFTVIGVAIYLAGTLAIFPTLYAWAALLICTGFYLFKLADDNASALFASIIKTVGLISLLWGCLSLIGGTLSDDDNVLAPLSGIELASSANTQTKSANTGLDFQRTDNLDEVKRLLASAKKSGKPVLVDFYADWCLDCKRMHRTTFKEASVAQALNGWDLIEIDVTDTSDKSEEVKRHFGVFGPPATLFFKGNGEENNDLRQYGYMNEDVFVNLINKAGS